MDPLKPDRVEVKGVPGRWIAFPVIPVTPGGAPVEMTAWLTAVDEGKLTTMPLAR
jgi:hypothetical protein